MCHRQSNSSQARNSRRAIGAFTLVELLVVIGIIAVLVAILLPALTRARQSALRTTCAARMHTIALAAQLHRSDHRDYFTLVGVVPGIQPQNLDDSDAAKYDYNSNDYTGINQPFYARRLSSIAESLGAQMSQKNQLMQPTNTQAVALMYDHSSYLINFLCPAQAGSFGELAAKTPAQYSLLYYCYGVGNGDSGYNSTPQSYIYNEAVLGWNDSLGRLRGKASLIRQASQTMFAADGIHGPLGTEVSGLGMYTLFNTTAKAPVTMADALTNDGLASDPASFDKLRHQGKINIAFCDGHVETRTISKNDLNTVFLLAP